MGLSWKERCEREEEEGKQQHEKERIRICLELKKRKKKRAQKHLNVREKVLNKDENKKRLVRKKERRESN